MYKITDKDVGEALGWIEIYDQRSERWKTVPYWDEDGEFMRLTELFNPTTDICDALGAIEHLIDTEKITAMEICEMLINHIANKRIFEKEQL